MSEASALRQALLSSHDAGCVLFRNNTGMGWVGRTQRLMPGAAYIVKAGDVILGGARPLHAGLCKGSSDCIGWSNVIVTAEMVGLPLAVFTAVEVKAKGGHADKHQKQFIEQVNRARGIGMVLREGEDFIERISAGAGGLIGAM